MNGGLKESSLVPDTPLDSEDSLSVYETECDGLSLTRAGSDFAYIDEFDDETPKFPVILRDNIPAPLSIYKLYENPEDLVGEPSRNLGTPSFSERHGHKFSPRPDFIYGQPSILSQRNNKPPPIPIGRISVSPSKGEENTEELLNPSPFIDPPSTFAERHIKKFPLLSKDYTIQEESPTSPISKANTPKMAISSPLFNFNFPKPPPITSTPSLVTFKDKSSTEHYQVENPSTGHEDVYAKPVLGKKTMVDIRKAPIREVKVLVQRPNSEPTSTAPPVTVSSTNHW